MDPMELSSLNELLDRIAALGIAMDYDRIGLKPEQREINSPLVTHQIEVVEERVLSSDVASEAPLRQGPLRTPLAFPTAFFSGTL